MCLQQYSKHLDFLNFHKLFAEMVPILHHTLRNMTQHINRFSLFPVPLNVGWICDLLWPIEWNGSDASSGLSLQKPCAPALSLLEVWQHPLNKPRSAWWRMREQEDGTRSQRAKRTQPKSGKPLPAHNWWQIHEHLSPVQINRTTQLAHRVRSNNKWLLFKALKYFIL